MENWQERCQFDLARKL